MTAPLLVVERLRKRFGALLANDEITFEAHPHELHALIGPNGAGKTTLINIICGIVTPTSGKVLAAGYDVTRDYRAARAKIGLVPQELTTDSFETVWATTTFSRGLFGRAPNPAHIDKVLRDLSLWDKRHDRIRTLSGGMKRRVLIAKALAHEPEILFLDEPTAGVDVELRRDMWAMVRSLRERGVTIILTTHYIEEAEEMADRIGVISQGSLILVEEKVRLMKQLGKKQVSLHLAVPLARIPDALGAWKLELKGQGRELVLDCDVERPTGTYDLLRRLNELSIVYSEINTHQTSLEDIFVGLVSTRS
jgi:ABC-2 type transport system ATP-binding protein